VFCDPSRLFANTRSVGQLSAPPCFFFEFRVFLSNSRFVYQVVFPDICQLTFIHICHHLCLTLTLYLTLNMRYFFFSILTVFLFLFFLHILHPSFPSLLLFLSCIFLFPFLIPPPHSHAIHFPFFLIVCLSSLLYFFLSFVLGVFLPFLSVLASLYLCLMSRLVTLYSIILYSFHLV
jgi:hypothetical protein